MNDHRTFLFYDYETFGTHTSLDKPAQFASIRTDSCFNIIENPNYFYCYPSDDYLPDPHAILLTGITPLYTKKHGSNEYYFSEKIHNILTKSNTCIIGYNNIHFDDEITRNIFYRNFFNPYEWSWKYHNSRIDLLKIARACYALRPCGIQWAYNKDNLPIFSLSQLSQANNILHNNIHDAVSDVYATIEIAKLIKKKQPKLFNFFYKYRKKNNLYQLINLNSFRPIIYIDNCFSALRNNTSFILPLIWSVHNRNVLIAVDLFNNVEQLINFLKKVSLNHIFLQDIFHLGIILIYLNRCPILAPIQSLRKKDAQRLNFNEEIYQKKIDLIKNNYSIFMQLNTVLLYNDIYQKSSNVDMQLYDAFFNTHDQFLMNLIHKNIPNNLNNIQFNFHDARLDNLFFRFKARNFFDMLNIEEKKSWINYCLNVLNPSLLKKYIFQIEELLEHHSHNTKNINLLHDLLKYLFKKYKYLFYKNIKLN